MSSNLVEVKAPIAGVFYRKPAPEEAPYIEIGHIVQKKQILCLLETMKVFQKIKSPIEGKIVEIVAQDGHPVSDSEVLIVIERS